MDKDSTLTEVAARVSAALQGAGIIATLSGGSAVTIYTQNDYESRGMDFVTAAMLNELKPVMEQLGFVHTANRRLSVFEHPEIEWYVEFVAAPISFGATQVNAEECGSLETPAGLLRVITPTQSVMDRLAAAFAWGDAQSREQALMVARQQTIDWSELRRWFLDEGLTESDYQGFRNLADYENA